MIELQNEILACRKCTELLPLGPRPVFQCGSSARILIAAQAPGKKVHATGIPFADASGERLRMWLGIDSSTFYDAKKIAILPMGFCYPGTGVSGDLPPRPECAQIWRQQLLQNMPDITLTLAIGRYAQRWHLREANKTTLTDTVRAWREYGPKLLPLPHPSPLNNRWLKKNPWFMTELVPELQNAVRATLASG